ncbi:hypothetical protein Leryth_021142 [Lithospermum erythrorhizon]|nr:hypothetical protein Leryth_021142 [Lithospermum erythrorhizon]
MHQRETRLQVLLPEFFTDKSEATGSPIDAGMESGDKLPSEEESQIVPTIYRKLLTSAVSATAARLQVLFDHSTHHVAF